VMRPRLLRDFGGRVTTVLAKDWYEDSQAELTRISQILAEAFPAR